LFELLNSAALLRLGWTMVYHHLPRQLRRIASNIAYIRFDYMISWEFWPFSMRAL